MLDIRRMMLLCDLADLGSVSAVAKRRDISSSAVSQQLRVLEHEADATLFHRDGRTLGLTRAGEVLVEHVRVIIAAVDEAASAVAATRAGTAGQVTIASFNMGISMLAAPVVSRLATRVPDLHIEIQQGSAESALRMLRRGELDIAITCRYEFESQSSSSALSEIALMDEPLVLLAPPNRHAGVRAHGSATLADLPWVTGLAGTGLSSVLQHRADSDAFTPKIKHRVIGAQNICMLAATEAAAAVVPKMAVPQHLEHFVVDGLDVGARAISAVVREGRQRDPNITLVLREMHAIVADSMHEPLDVAV
ncbi:LysR family transcriptional regulator [Rhodococcoides yunnanense]|uniref:LysR family transcriptional regulator n=1 Tax=Rhodococcoides yunnanense TaxID=278209 RepID=UPI00093262E7|nr:LysR family transcriptional regulator [Rhodococcus yunnanensis]